MKILNIAALISLATISYAGSIATHIPYGITASCDQILEREAYVSCYDYKAKNPSWVSYTVTKEQEKKRLKRINPFKEDKDIPIAYRSTLKDYKGSNYDRGHLFPNALADYSIKTRDESFILSNIVPQLGGLNRTAWKELEEDTRKLLRKDKILNIVSGAIYNSNHKYIGNKVSVPDYFFKVIYSENKNKMYAYILPQRRLKDSDYKKYATTVREVENITDIDFFSELGDEVQEKLENEKNRL